MSFSHASDAPNESNLSETLLSNPKPTPPNKTQWYQGTFLMLLSAFVYSLLFVIIKWLSNVGFPSSEILIFRSSIQSILVISIVIVTNYKCIVREMCTEVSTMETNTKWFVFCRGAISSVASICYYEAISLLPVGDAIALFSTFPIYTAFISYFVLKEHINYKHFIALIVCLIGAICITQPALIFGTESRKSQIHDTAWQQLEGGVLALIAAFLMGFVCVVIRLAHQAPTFTLVFSQGFCTFVVALIYGLSFQQMLSLITWKDYIGMISLGLVGYLAILSMTKSGQMIAASYSSMLRSTDIVWTYILQICLFTTIPDWITMVGVIFTVIGIILVAFDKLSRAKEKSKMRVELTINLLSDDKSIQN